MTSQRGMTLVELLVVVAIMMLLVAVGAPMLRPMLEKQGTSQGAQSLRVMLLRARNMAVEKGIPFALRLERVQDVNVGPTHAAVKLSIWRESPTIGTANDIGASITNGGAVTLYQLSGNVWSPMNDSSGTAMTLSHVESPLPPGTEVQFFGAGEIYIVTGNIFENEIGADAKSIGSATDPAPIFIVTPQTRELPTSVPPLLMPEGICVDLEFSGIGKSRPLFTGLPDDVLIWFLSDGSVDRVKCGTVEDKCDGLVHFLIGSWEQVRVRENIGTLSEDTRTNLELPANIWVTLDPRSGRVVINEIKVPSTPGDVTEARKFANEIWNEVAAPR